MVSKEKYAKANDIKANTFRGRFPKKKDYEKQIKLQDEIGDPLKGTRVHKEVVGRSRKHWSNQEQEIFIVTSQIL